MKKKNSFFNCKVCLKISNNFHDSLTLLSIVPILLLTNKKKLTRKNFEEKQNILELIFKANKAH